MKVHQKEKHEVVLALLWDVCCDPELGRRDQLPAGRKPGLGSVCKISLGLEVKSHHTFLIEQTHWHLSPMGGRVSGVLSSWLRLQCTKFWFASLAV